ncbi:MAG: OmpH family outer membrane protein [Candidatus Kapaibacteriota bacterium]
MKSIRFLTLLPVFIILAFNLAYTQFKSTPQIKATFGVVDVNLIVEQLPEAKEADAKLRELQKNLQDTLMKMQESIQKKLDNYQKQKSMMPPDQQQKQEQALLEEQQKMQQFYNEKLNEIQSKREEFLEPIRNKVKSAIQFVAMEENLTIVFDKGNLLYSEDNLDITYKVLDRIKRGLK